MVVSCEGAPVMGEGEGAPVTGGACKEGSCEGGCTVV